MKTCYKLTNYKMETRGGHPWWLGNWRNEASSGGMIQGYEHPLLAAFHDPVHGRYLENPGARLFKCEMRGRIKREQMQCGASEMRLLTEVEVPQLTPEQHIRYAILSAAEVAHVEHMDWARNWLAWAAMWWSDIDQTCESAWAAAELARAAESAEARAAESAAESVVWKAGACKAAWWVAWATAWAVSYAVEKHTVDLITLAEIALSGDPTFGEFA